MKHKPAADLIWANLIHVSMNMWASGYRPYLRFDDRLWRDLVKRMADAGLNMVVLDLGDAVRYRSHPELAVQGAWTRARLRHELAELRRRGLEPIPKLNFSAGHDSWLGTYSRCVSTPAYYRVCRDLIRETLELFDRPRFFHLGLDEERPENQAGDDLMVVRSKTLWEHDVKLLFDQVWKGGARPWMWADAYWHWGPDYERMIPRSVVQGNWVYGRLQLPRTAPPPTAGASAYLRLDAAGYDQILTASNMFWPDNIRRTAAFARRHLHPGRLLGFLQTSWRPTLEAYRETHFDAIDRIGAEIARWDGRPAPGLCATKPLVIPERPGIRVGVYRGNEGACHLVAALQGDRRLNAFDLPGLKPRHLNRCQVVVVSRVWRSHEYLRMRRHLKAWVRAGGRLALLYDAAGWNAMRPPLFPQIARPVGKAPSPLIVAEQTGPGARIARRAPRTIRHGFVDHLRFQAGRRGMVLARDQGRAPVVVAGRFGRGRVMVNGVMWTEPLPRSQQAWLAALVEWLGRPAG